MTSDPDAETPSWTQLRERGSHWVFRCMVALYGVVGRHLIEPAIYPFVIYFYATDAARRGHVREYLRRLWTHTNPTAGPDDEPSAWDVLKVYLAFGHVVFDRVALWMGLRDSYDVTYPDRTKFREYLHADHGAILLSFHAGNFGLMRYAAHARDITINVVGYWENSPVINRLLEETNPAASLNVLQIEPSNPEHVLRLKDRVEAGEYVAMLGDRLSAGSHRRSVECTFLGGRARFPTGPYLLAYLLGCPILLTYCVRTAHHAYKVHADAFAESVDLPREGRSEALRTYAQRYANRLEDVCQRYPYQWFNFYDFWS